MADIPLRKIYGGTDRTVQWAATRGLRYSSGRGFKWLKTGRSDHLSPEPSWLDHMTAWITKDGRRLLLTQPYGLGQSALEEMLDECKRNDIRVQIGGDGWYGNGTIAILFSSLT